MVAALYGAVSAALMRVARLESSACSSRSPRSRSAPERRPISSAGARSRSSGRSRPARSPACSAPPRPRFQLSALAYFALALGHSVAVEEWEQAVFVLSPHPATAWPTLVALAAAAAALAWFTPAFARTRRASSGPVRTALAGLRPARAAPAGTSAARLRGGGRSGACHDVARSPRGRGAAPPDAELGFDRGQVAVDILGCRRAGRADRHGASAPQRPPGSAGSSSARRSSSSSATTSTTSSDRSSRSRCTSWAARSCSLRSPSVDSGRPLWPPCSSASRCSSAG